MTTINVSPKHSIVEATQYVGTPESAWDIMGQLRAAAAAAGNNSLNLSYSEGAGQTPEFAFYYNNESYIVRNGDWLIKDDTLFSVCREAEYDLRFATEPGLS